MPNAEGKLGTLVIVASQDLHQSLKPLVDSSFLYPLQEQALSEPFYELMKPDIEEFNKFYYNQKSILVLVEESQLEKMNELLEPFSFDEIKKLINDKEPKLMIQRNLFAKYQHIVYLFAKDKNDMKTKLRKCRAQLSSSLMSYELEDQNEKLFSDTSANSVYFEMIKKELGLGVKIPKGFKMTYHQSQTYRFDYNSDHEPKTITLLVHAYAVKDSSDYSLNAIRAVRDTISKYLVKGEIPGTYMSTSDSKYYPQLTKEEITLNANRAVKVKGWWTIKGMSQAGPFLRYVVKVPSRNTVLAFEGFIYTPDLNLKERDLRLIESIALSIK